jgi:hypothetical protein
MLWPTIEMTIKHLKTGRLSPNEEILHNAITWKSDADTGFKLRWHYSSAMNLQKETVNCE